MTDRKTSSEISIIERYFKPLAADMAGAFNLEDDAGCLEIGQDESLVLTADTIVEGIHYLKNATPQDIGYKALAVNVSDLCAKGAQPLGYLMTLALPQTNESDWLEGLSRGLADAQSDFGCKLLGGDTVHTTGPAVITITAAGAVQKGQMVHRSGAKDGDLVYVTGTIGDAALGLLLLKGEAGAAQDLLTPEQQDFLKRRYWRPEPRLQAVPLVKDHASASMDISDGLVGDFAKLVRASKTGGEIEAADLPLSEAATAAMTAAPELLEPIMTGGDDYELLLTVPQSETEAFKASAAGQSMRVTRVGRILSSVSGVTVRDANGNKLNFKRPSFDHF